MAIRQAEIMKFMVSRFSILTNPLFLLPRVINVFLSSQYRGHCSVIKLHWFNEKTKDKKFKRGRVRPLNTKHARKILHENFAWKVFLVITNPFWTSKVWICIAITLAVMGPIFWLIHRSSYYYKIYPDHLEYFSRY